MSLYFKAFCRHECYNYAMQSAIKKQQKQGCYENLSAAELLVALAVKDQILEDKCLLLEEKNEVHQKHLGDKNHIILEQGKRIDLLEEYLRLATVQKFGASSEKLAFQSDFERGFRGIEKDLPRGANHGGKNSADQAKLRSKVIKITTQEKPKDGTHWTTRGLAKVMGINHSFIIRFFRVSYG